MQENLNFFWDKLVAGSEKLALLSLFFIFFSFILKRQKAVDDGLRAKSETKLNLVYYFIDLLAITPLFVIGLNILKQFFHENNLILFDDALKTWPPFLVAFMTIFVSDFIGYWRHRLMHTRVLWPVHTVHHSDTQLTWLGLARFHPINRLITTILNAVGLTLIGVPPWAVFLNGLVRHYYGFFIHADIPFTYGPLRYVFVSPVMHRWHHIKDEELSGKNFSTVFSFFDLAFGTFHVPGTKIGDLGVPEEKYPTTWLGQFIYPFKIWTRRVMGSPKPVTQSEPNNRR